MGKITLSIGVLFDVERFLREYLLCIWYSSYGSMIVPPQPSGWYPPINKFSSMVKLQILRHPMFFLGWNSLNPSKSTKSFRFFMIFLWSTASKSRRLRHLSRSIKSLVNLEGVELLRTSGPQWGRLSTGWDPRSSSCSVALKKSGWILWFMVDVTRVISWGLSRDTCFFCWHALMFFVEMFWWFCGTMFFSDENLWLDFGQSDCCDDYFTICSNLSRYFLCFFLQTWPEDLHAVRRCFVLSSLCHDVTGRAYTPRKRSM